MRKYFMCERVLLKRERRVSRVEILRDRDNAEKHRTGKNEEFAVNTVRKVYTDNGREWEEERKRGRERINRGGGGLAGR